MMRGKHGRGILLALVAGTMAALASTSAKLAMTAEAVQQICSDIVQRFIYDSTQEEAEIQTVLCDSVSILLIGIALIMQNFIWVLTIHCLPIEYQCLLISSIKSFF